MEIRDIRAKGRWDFEIRADGENRHIEGKAISFGTVSNYIGWYETIHAEAITDELIQRSNIYFCANHDPATAIARWHGGNGDLKITRNDDGVYFSLDVPPTKMGDDILISIRNHTYEQCSFCFAIDPDDGAAQEWNFRDGQYYRDIYRIAELMDLSCVTTPAYEDTYVQARDGEIKTLLDDMIKETRTDEEIDDEKKKDEEENVPEGDENGKAEEPTKKEEKADTEDEKAENEDDSEKEGETEKDEEEKPDEDDEKRSINNTNKTQHNIMSKKTFMGELRNAINSNSKSFAYNAETRTVNVTGSTDGIHDTMVEEEFQGLLTPLYADSVLTQLGCRWYTGLPAGDYVIDVMASTGGDWAAENGNASEAGYTFTAKTLKPKRLSVTVAISNQVIAQDTKGVEAAIRQDIVDKINAKLQATILGSGAKSDTTPAGIFNGADTNEIDSFADIANLEAKIDDTNIKGEKKYLIANGVKAFLRTTVKGANANAGFIMENGEIDGTQAIANSDVPAKNLVYGAFDNLAIGSWGDLRIIVDNVTGAKNDVTYITVNGFFDAIKLRDNAFAFAQIA